MTFCWHQWGKQADLCSAVMFLAVFEALSVCGSCTLAVLVGCGLSSVLFMYPQFLLFFFLFFVWPLIPLISLTVASLQGVAQDFMLSCNHCLTLSLLSVPLLSCWSLLQPPQLCSLHYLLLSLSVVVLHRCGLSFLFCFTLLRWSFEFVLCSLTCFLFFDCQTPSTLCPPCVLPWFSAAPVYSSVVGQWVSVLFM